MPDGTEALLSPAQARRKLSLGRDLVLQVATSTLEAFPEGISVPLTAAEPAVLEAGQIIAVASDQAVVLARFLRHDWTTVPQLVCGTDTGEFLVDWDELVGAARVETPLEVAVKFTAPRPALRTTVDRLLGAVEGTVRRFRRSVNA